MKKLSLIALLLVGCTKATPPAPQPNPDEGKPGMVKPEPPPAPPPAPKVNATVELSAVTFADDCGGTVPLKAPTPVPSNAPSDSARAPAAPATMVAPSVVAEKRRPGAQQEPLNRRCEQTSMQLVVVASADTDIAVKSVTVFDDAGKELGTLTTSKPTRWTTDKYEAWDGKVAAGQTAQVSYVVSQPSFVNHFESHDKTYTVKVVASVGGVDQPLQTTVLVVALPPPVPT